MRDLTRSDLRRYRVFDSGYCTLQNLIKTNLVEEIGKNTGVYGWNWTAYRVIGTNAVILDSYRNGLKQWFKNFSDVRSELEEIDSRCVKLYAKSEQEKAQILEDLQNVLTK